MHQMVSLTEVTEKWDVFELTLIGPETKNPFTDVEFGARFRRGEDETEVLGFYDGDRTYRVRFMPGEEGPWTLTTFSNRDGLNNFEAAFLCTAPGPGNRGPVDTAGEHHFAYRDGTPYYPFGSTSYGWAHQPEEAAKETVRSLVQGGFNKFRTGIMPHYSRHSEERMACFPFSGQGPCDWDFSRPDPAYFRIMESRILALREEGIEADLILFHPYSGPWKLGQMPLEADRAYLRYAVSRFAAYRNVWWSLANEYDLLKEKTMDHWHELCRYTAELDPYSHLLSIHNWQRLYEAWKPWITHACIQDGLAVELPGRAIVLRNAYHKPVIYDEVCYEGNFSLRWGDLDGPELVHRFWQGFVAGTYVGHGEVIQPEGETDEIVWTGIGGALRGESPSRIAFLRKLAEELPGHGWDPVDHYWHWGMAKKGSRYVMVYFGKEERTEWEFLIPSKDLEIPEGTRYRAELIDAWEMTVTPVEGEFTVTGKDQYNYGDRDGRRIPLPGRPYQALRLRPAAE